MVTPSEDAGFPKSHRLRTRQEFKRVFEHRTSVANPVLVIYGMGNGLDHCRLGLVVSRKVGRATVRNRWKRLIREAFRLHQRQLPIGLDLVVLPRAGYEPEWEAVKDALAHLAERVSQKVSRKRAIPAKKSPTSTSTARPANQQHRYPPPAQGRRS